MDFISFFALIIVSLSAYYLALILFFLRGLTRLNAGRAGAEPSFSVLIAARNEERLIGQCLESVLAQDYPFEKYEVIVVDDRSTDHTGAVVESYRSRFERLKLVRVEHCPEGLSPKKHALSLGLREASGEMLLFTDADCIVPSTWIRAIASHVDARTSAVAGLTTYYRVPDMPALLWGLEAMDFFSHGVVSASALGAGLPINTNANNFAVRRELLCDLGDYASLGRIVSGDDDLVLQAVSRNKQYRVRYAPEKEAAVQTAPTRTLRGIWEQRKRWSSKTVYYNPAQALVLSLVFLFYCSILTGFMAAPFRPGVLPWALGAFALKTLLDFGLAYCGMILFDKKELTPYFFPLALLHIPLIVLACFFGIFGKFAWKDGLVRKRLEAGQRSGA